PFAPAIRRLAALATLDLLPPGTDRVANALFATFADVEAFLVIPSPELLAREVTRLKKDLDKTTIARDKLAKKLDNPGFLAKAAADIVAKDRAALGEAEDALRRLGERLQRLGGDGAGAGASGS